MIKILFLNVQYIRTINSNIYYGVFIEYNYKVVRCYVAVCLCIQTDVCARPYECSRCMTSCELRAISSINMHATRNVQTDVRRYTWQTNPHFGHTRFESDTFFPPWAVKLLGGSISPFVGQWQRKYCQPDSDGDTNLPAARSDRLCRLNYNQCHVLCTRASNVIETRQTYCVAYAGRSIIVPGLKKEYSYTYTPPLGLRGLF